MPNYVSSGYVEVGYVEGDVALPMDAGNHPMKFFVSSGTRTEAELKSAITASLNDTDIAVIYMQEKSKILLGSTAGFIEFLGGVDIQSIITDQTFIDKVAELTTINLSADILANDGSVVANATVTQIDATTFDVTIPPELVGTSYKIEFSQS